MFGSYEKLGDRRLMNYFEIHNIEEFRQFDFMYGKPMNANFLQRQSKGERKIQNARKSVKMEIHRQSGTGQGLL